MSYSVRIVVLFIALSCHSIVLASKGVAQSATDNAPRSTEQTLDALGAAVFDADTDSLLEVFNTEKFVARVLGHLNFDTELESEIGDTLFEAVPDMMRSLAGVFKDCRLTLTRLREGLTQGDAVLRCDLNSTLQFYQFFLEKNKTDQFEIVDWFDFDAASLRSMTVAQLTAAGTGNMHVLNRLMGVRGQAKQEYLVLNLLAHDPQVTPYEEFERIYQALPGNVRNSRALMVYRSAMAYSSDDSDDYRRALSDLFDGYGHDPRLAYTLIDHYYYKKDYVVLYKVIDRYIDEFEGDGGLLNLKAALLREQGKTEDAIQAAELALELEPYYPDAYMTLLGIHLQRRNHSGTLSVIKRMEQKFDVVYTAADFSSSSPDEMAFVASTEFKQYLLERNKATDVTATP